MINSKKILGLVILIIGLVALGIGIFFLVKYLQKAKTGLPEKETKTQTQQLTGDFEACKGIDTSEKERVAYHRILLAKSNDALNFTRLDQVISDRASVPDLMIDKDGNIRLYYIQVACKEQNLKNTPVLAISYDQGQTWVYKRLKIEAPSQAAKCKEPGGTPPPVDPDVILMPDGSYRLYATCPNTSASQETPMTFVFFSEDGINFKDAKPTFTPQGGRALDPVVIKIDSQWHLFNGDEKGGTLEAVSDDGITFTEKDQFCPFKFTFNNKQKCYIIGDTLTLTDPTRYRIYLFGNTPDEGIKSIISDNGTDWQMEQETGQYILNIDANSSTEYHELASPTVAKLKDGSYLMAYESFIPETPSSIISGQTQQNSQPSENQPKEQMPKTQQPPIQPK